MKELVILSLNVIYIKDGMQQLDRIKARLQYLDIPTGSLDNIEQDYINRKRSLNKRIKVFIEELVNSKKEQSKYVFNIDVEHACLTKKQLDKGYAVFSNIYGFEYALNLRNGALLPIYDSELQTIKDPNLRNLEYTADHEGSVLKYFEIDITDPLKNELRY
jgi:hypothetical protein